MSSVDAPLPSGDPRMAGLPAAVVQRLHAAARAIRDGQAQVAERALHEALTMAPGHPEALRLSGIHHTRAGRPQDAIAAIRQALAQWPDDALLQTDLGSALNAAGEHEAAFASWRRACTLAPDNPMGWFNLGRNLQLRGESEDAVGALQRASELAPAMWPASVLLGDALVHLGRFDDAAASYRRVLGVHPACGDAWRGLANIKTQPLSTADRRQMQAQLARADIADPDRVTIGLALGKALEDACEHEAAFAAIRDANARQARLTPWRADAFHKDMQALVAATRALPSPLDARLGEEVIFIVGMPRSGSTLFEQILASHPQVEGASELGDLSAAIEAESRRRRQGLLQWLPVATAEDWQRLGRDYLARTARWRRQRPRHTDKMPENWRFTGLLATMLPGARIVDARRDPLESGWSCFKQPFYLQPHFANTLGDIADYRRDYEAAMAAWQAARPDAIRLQTYEDLLADPEAQVRALLAFCGLDFDPACLQFHAASRSVRTASAAQVRQPLRRDTARAQHYGARLDALRPR